MVSKTELRLFSTLGRPPLLSLIEWAQPIPRRRRLHKVHLEFHVAIDRGNFGVMHG